MVSIANWVIWGLSLFLGAMVCLFIGRIVLSWFPQIEADRPPITWITRPTEPLLAPLRRVIPPLGGVDITPIVWVGILSLLREILVGQQGLLPMFLPLN